MARSSLSRYEKLLCLICVASTNNARYFRVTAVARIEQTSLLAEALYFSSIVLHVEVRCGRIICIIIFRIGAEESRYKIIFDS